MNVRIVPMVLVGLVAAACSANPAADPGVTGTVDGSPTTTIIEAVHVDRLEGSSSNLGNTWTADVTVTLVDSAGEPVAGATVTGVWAIDEISEQSCETGTTGQCNLTSEPLKKNVNDATLTIEAVEHPTLVYRSTDDHDPDPRTDGTSITVSKTN